jgi:hypothetical protein
LKEYVYNHKELREKFDVSKEIHEKISQTHSENALKLMKEAMEHKEAQKTEDKVTI